VDVVLLCGEHCRRWRKFAGESDAGKRVGVDGHHQVEELVCAFARLRVLAASADTAAGSAGRPPAGRRGGLDCARGGHGLAGT